MNRVSVFVRKFIGVEMQEEVAALEVCGIPACLPGGSFRLMLDSTGKPEKREWRQTKGARLPDNVIKAIISRLEIGHGIGDVGEYHWKDLS